MHPDFSQLRLRIAGLTPESIVDGPGIRLTVFTQGCPHACWGCHNPSTHPFGGGYSITLQEILLTMEENALLDGVTLSGGEPFCQAKALIPLAQEIKDRSYHLCIYSGYTWEQLLASPDPAVHDLLSLADLLVDGPFVLSKRSLELLFRGSSNQRLIDVPASLKAGTVQEWKVRS